MESVRIHTLVIHNHTRRIPLISAGGQVRVEHTSLLVNEGGTVMFCVRLIGETGSPTMLANPLIVNYEAQTNGNIGTRMPVKYTMSLLLISRSR